MKIFKRKEVLMIATIIVFLVSLTYAQGITEKFKTGTYIDGLTYNPYSGKFAVRDGRHVYSFNPITDDYEELFCIRDLNLNPSGADICYISSGYFSGNFLMNGVYEEDPDKRYKKLLIVSPSGTLISEVKVKDFEMSFQGLTEITSGPYMGCFATFGYTEASGGGRDYHIYIFQIKGKSGSTKAYLVKDIQSESIGTNPRGLCFLPDSHADYPDHFVISTYHRPPPQITISVIDQDGIEQDRAVVDYYYEGLTYISTGSYLGNLAVCDAETKDSWIGDWDGGDPFNMAVGIGLGRPNVFAWQASTEQLLLSKFEEWENHVFHFLSRTSPGNWIKVGEATYTDIGTFRDITYADGFFYILGFTDREFVPDIGNIPLCEVHKLDSGFHLQATYSLHYDDLFGIDFKRIFYNSDEEIFLVVPFRNRLTGERIDTSLYIFNSTFTDPDKVDLRSLTDKAEYIYSGCYDPDNQWYYILNRSLSTRKYLLLVFNSNGELIAECDLGYLNHCGGFYDLTKITSGVLAGKFIMLDNTNSEILIVELEEMIIRIPYLENEVNGSGISEDLINSFVKKLQNALKAYENGNINAAIGMMNAFKNQVQEEKGNAISEVVADEWISVSDEIIQRLEDLLN